MQKTKRFKIIQDNTGYFVPKTLIISSNFFKEVIKFNKIGNPFNYNWSNLALPPEFYNELFSRINNTFNNHALVIRSSATCEDSPCLSFAGQYSSYLNVKAEKDIIKNILGYYKSLFSENALLYASLNKVDLNKESMAIIIQEIIPVTKAGIIFTADPITGSKENIIIEYTNSSAAEIT